MIRILCCLRIIILLKSSLFLLFGTDERIKMKYHYQINVIVAGFVVLHEGCESMGDVILCNNWLWCR